MPLTNGSQPMKAGLRIALGFGQQMLAAAEADFEAHGFDRRGKEIGRIGRRRRVERERQPRQKMLDQHRLMGTQRMSLAPSEKGAGALPIKIVACGHGNAASHDPHSPLIPADAGIQATLLRLLDPAFAGVSGRS